MPGGNRIGMVGTDDIVWRIVIVGPPGGGKGTQGKRLASALGVVHLSVGDLIRTEIQKATEIGNLIDSIVSEGGLVNDDTVCTLIAKELGAGVYKNGFVLDGFPRTIKQAHFLQKYLSEHDINLDGVVQLELDTDTVIKRNIGRRHCENCERDYNTYFDPPIDDDICDGCGSSLKRREDCLDTALERRLREYSDQISAILKFYENTGFLIPLSGSGSKTEIHQTVLDQIDKMKPQNN